MPSEGKAIPCCIGVDLMGSDSSPKEGLETILRFSRELPDQVQLVLFGTADVFSGVHPHDNFTFFPVQEVVAMEDPPLEAIRKKKHSSLHQGIRSLKEGKIQAFISAGNTGALIGCAILQLPLLPAVERPALLTLLPTRQDELAVLDVGANTVCKPEHLVQFALMGVAYQFSRGITIPRVGLLNIGSEACKGTPGLQEAYNQLERISASPPIPFYFAGNVEGRDAFNGGIDVLVTDGFTGNVFLKTSEGIAATILTEFEKATSEQCSLHLKGILKEMRRRLHYTEYPGAILCGTEGLVIKCHGDLTSQSLTRSISTAIRLIQHNFLAQMKIQLQLHKSSNPS